MTVVAKGVATGVCLSVLDGAGLAVDRVADEDVVLESLDRLHAIGYCGLRRDFLAVDEASGGRRRRHAWARKHGRGREGLHLIEERPSTEGRHAEAAAHHGAHEQAGAAKAEGGEGRVSQRIHKRRESHRRRMSVGMMMGVAR